MAIENNTVKSKKSAVKKKTAMKKTTAKKRIKNAVKKSVGKKAPVRKAPVRKAAMRKGAVKKRRAKKSVTGNPAVARAKALREELAIVKAELKASRKKEAGLERIVSRMNSDIEKFISGMVKKEMAGLEKSLKSKPRKRRARKVN